MLDSSFLFVIGHFLLGYGMAYTSPSSSFRIPIFLLIVVCSLLSVRSPLWEHAFGPAGAIATEYVIGFIYHSSHWLLLVKLSPSPLIASTTGAKNLWALNQIFNSRWGITHLPAFDGKDLQYVPSRSKLFLRRLWDLAWTSAFIYLMNAYRLNVEPEDFLVVSSNSFRRLLEITPRELIIRVYMFVYGYGTPYCALRAAHSLATCVALACGDTPDRWPPLFGSFDDAVTLRQWYSVFWHQLMRRAFTAHAIFLVHDCCRLPRKGGLTRSLVVILTFLFSALLHILASPSLGHCSMYNQLRYHVNIIAAIFAEDLVASVYRSYIRPPPVSIQYIAAKSDATAQRKSAEGVKAEKDDGQHLLGKLLGFSWVLVFHIWNTSELAFNTSTCLLQLG